MVRVLSAGLRGAEIRDLWVQWVGCTEHKAWGNKRGGLPEKAL